MADYDVGVIGLSSPPASAPLTTYRPALSVRNNGIHNAVAFGSIRIYKAGSLVWSSDVYSATIPPGDTRLAEAVDYWLPDGLGSYMVSGEATCDLDQVPGNNFLAPTTISVTAVPPPPPPPVEAHAAQHEEGGSDQVNVQDLEGTLLDPQTPTPHKNDHEAGGDDELSVAGLMGVLGQAQPISAHAGTHQSGGPDQIIVSGLTGVLHDAQTPKTHKSSHQASGADQIDVTGLSGLLTDSQYPKIHGATGHDATVEAVANKDQPYGYPGLDGAQRIGDNQNSQTVGFFLLLASIDQLYNIISYPSQPAVHAYLSAAQVINSGVIDTVIFNTKTQDTRDEYSPSTGIYTAKSAGNFLISASAIIAGTTFTTAQFLQLFVYVDGVLRKVLGLKYGNGASIDMHVCGADSILLLAGQQLDIRANHNYGSSRNLAASLAYSSLSIVKIT